MIYFQSKLKDGFLYFGYETKKWVFDMNFRLDRFKFGFEWDIHKFELYSFDIYFGLFRFGIQRVGE